MYTYSVIFAIILGWGLRKIAADYYNDMQRRKTNAYWRNICKNRKSTWEQIMEINRCCAKALVKK